MIETKRFGVEAGIVGSGRSIYIASVFILNIGLARSMGREVFGSFQQVFMFSALFMVLTLGIPETLYYFLPRLKDDERSQFLGQTFLLLGAAGGFVAFILWSGASAFAHIQKNPSIAPQIRMFGLYGAFLIASSFSDPVFIIYKKIRNLFLLSAVHGIFFVALTVWQYTSQISLDTLFKAMVVFGFCKYMLAVMLVRSMKAEIGPVSIFRGRSQLLLQLVFSMPVALSNTVEIISRWLDKYIVSIYLGPEALGVFYVGAIEIPFIGVVVSSIYSVVSPVLNKLHHTNDTRGFVTLVSKTFKFTSKIIWPVFTYLIVFADHLIPLVFKSDYIGAVMPFRVYLLMMPLRIASYGALILAIGRPRILFWSAFGALGLNFILNIVLVIKLGFIGPAIATTISTYFHVALLLFIITRELKIRLDELIPFGFLFSVGVTSGFAVLIAYALTYSMANDLTTVSTSFMIFACAYLFLGTKAGFIRFADFLEHLRGVDDGKGSDGKDG
ncbi:lipid II flippase MurJ [subsurface metagenome]